MPPPTDTAGAAGGAGGSGGAPGRAAGPVVGAPSGPKSPSGLNAPGAPLLDPLQPRSPRGPTARSRLTIDWQYPVYRNEARGEEASAVQGALPRAQAFGVATGDDPRPLLVLRECVECRGTDVALLSRQEDNEKTILLSRWFRCIKLPPSVLEEGHALTRLFPEEDPPHLFLASRDGSRVLPLNGAQSRRELWQQMFKTLRAEYKKDAGRSVTQLFKLLDKYDMIDEKIALLEDRLESLLDRYGRDSTKLKRVERDLEKAREEREALREEEQRVSELGLKMASTQRGGDGSDKG